MGAPQPVGHRVKYSKKRVQRELNNRFQDHLNEISLKEVREWFGLESKEISRECLRCGIHFLSAGPQNRLCKDCGSVSK